ncbi:hypothetical protein DFH09DRAFT_1131042 [Mycena vulgaris]|nr:hypothetical protein DFH09DRAFT_1131042 [Mycena vulgaris]
MWALGRTARPSDLNAEDPSLPYVSASDIPLRERPATEIRPCPLSVAEIQEYPKLYATAASNAVQKAEFDGVEIHSANGYLLDQFLQDVSNVRTDEYGGTPENRSRFSLEVLDVTGIRISPWNTYQVTSPFFLSSSSLDTCSDPNPTFIYLVDQIVKRQPQLAYIHVVKPRIDVYTTRAVIPEGWSSDVLRDIWVSPGSDRRFISAGGYTRALALERAETQDDLIAFGREFISNPDLPDRVLHDIPFNDYDRTKFYVPGSLDPKGFTDYPFTNASQLPQTRL